MALKINVLGPLIVESDHGRLGRAPRKAWLLLAYLATQRQQAVSRERLADLLWPGQSSEQSRHSLRSCLSGLRKALGPSAARHLIANRSECHVRDVNVDLERFKRLSGSAHRSEWSAAAELYRGEFLADLDIASQPCQEWLAAERQRTLNLICAVLQRLTAAQLAANEHDEAVQSARRLVALDPLSEAGHRALMRAYARAGRRAEALRQYRRCAEILTRELGVAPDPETKKLAQEIASLGSAAETRPSRDYEIPDNRAAMLSDALDHLSAEQGFHARAEPLPGKIRAKWACLSPGIAVGLAPLRNLTGDPDQQSLVEALTEDLVTDLLRQGLGLSFTPAMNERRSLVSPPRAIGLDAEYVLTGSVQRDDAGSLRVNMKITGAAPVEYQWAGQYELGPEGLGSSQTSITRTVSRDLRMLLLGEASRRDFKGSEVPLAADDCLSRAATALKEPMQAELTAEAQQWFLAALADDPHNVEALIGVARTCQHIVGQPWWADSREVAVSSDLGREAISIALSLAPGRALAQCIKGMLCSETGRLEEAADLFEGALARDPRLGVARGFGGYNAAFLGHVEMTLTAIERAMRLDQTDRSRSVFFFFGGFSELLLGRTEAAIALFEKSLERNSSYGAARLFMAAALSLIGRQDEAVRATASFREQYPGYRSSAFEQLWLSRSAYPTYRGQMAPLFDQIRALGAVD